jgi:hypothetical protein
MVRAIFICCAALVFFGVLLLTDELRYGVVRGEPLNPGQSTHIEPGQIAWFAGQVDADNEVWVSDLVYGCEEENPSQDEDNWSTLDTFSEPLLLTGEGGSVTVELEAGCADSSSADLSLVPGEEQNRRWRGYRRGQDLVVMGVVRTVDPLLLDVDEHYGGTSEQFRSRLRSKSYTLLSLFLGTLLVFCGLVFYAWTAGRDKWGWRDFARRRRLAWSCPHFWNSGRIEGESDDRPVSIRRHRGLGDLATPFTFLRMRLELNPCMEIHDLGDQSRLLDDEEVREGLAALHKMDLAVQVQGHWLELTGKRLDPEVLDHGLKQALSLARTMEKIESRGWHRAARTLNMGFEQEPHRWQLNAKARDRPRLVYERVDGTWRTSLSAQVGFQCVDWEIEPRGPGQPGTRTGDPVLDAQICARGGAAEALELLGQNEMQGQNEDITTVLMATICGQGIRLEDGALVLEYPGLVAEPTELLQDVERLGDLLQRAALLQRAQDPEST